VLVDLERGGILDTCFGLPFEFAVPDLLYKRELAEYGGEMLIGFGLRVEILAPEEVAAAQQLRSANPKLSLPDAFAFTLASGRGWALLAGDGILRALANQQKIPVHGVLWVFDRVFDAKTLAGGALADCLDRLASHPRCRLPKAEVSKRLELYRK
jgi:hypothetical protein